MSPHLYKKRKGGPAPLDPRFNFKPDNRLGPGCMVDLF
jgi:hypothetical protein